MAIGGEFAKYLSKLTGQKLLSVGTGEAKSSHFLMSFGSGIVKTKSLEHNKLNLEQPKYEGGYRLFVDYSSWRVGEGSKRLSDNVDCSSNRHTAISAFNKIIGRTVMSVNYDSKKKIFSLDFDSELFLEWLIEDHGYEELDNFCFYDGDKLFWVDGNCRVKSSQIEGATKIRRQFVGISN